MPPIPSDKKKLSVLLGEGEIRKMHTSAIDKEGETVFFLPPATEALTAARPLRRQLKKEEHLHVDKGGPLRLAGRGEPLTKRGPFSSTIKLPLTTSFVLLHVSSSLLFFSSRRVESTSLSRAKILLIIHPLSPSTACIQVMTRARTWTEELF